jgi:hypothetical protein
MATLTEAQLFAACTPELVAGTLPSVRAQVACPGTGGNKWVRLAMDPVTGRPTVVWCSRYGSRTMTCREECLQVDDIADD